MNLILQKHGKPVIVTGFADIRAALLIEAGYAPIVEQPIQTALNVCVTLAPPPTVAAKTKGQNHDPLQTI